MPEKRLKKRQVKMKESVSISDMYLFDFVASVQSFGSLYTEFDKLAKDSNKNLKLLTDKLNKLNKKLTKNPKNPSLNELLRLVNQVNTLSHNARLENRNMNIFASAFFVNLISRYDAFIIDVIRLSYKNTSLMLSPDKKLNYYEVEKSGAKSIQQVRDRFIEEEIETLRGSRTSQLKSIEKACGQAILENIGNQLAVFKETCARRNLIVHHDGYVTNRYIDLLKQLKLELPPKDTKKLTVDSPYFNKIAENLLSISLEIVFAVNYENADRQEILSSVLTKTVECIRFGNYKLAQVMLDVSMKYGLDENFYYINYALCLKKMRKTKAALQTLRNVKINPGNEQFKAFEVAVALIEERPSDALRVIRDITNPRELITLRARLELGQLIFEDFVHTQEYRRTVANMERKMKSGNLRVRKA